MPVNSLLFEAHPFTQPVYDQRRIESLLVGRQSPQDRPGWTVFGYPTVAMGEQRLTVHQHRACSWQPRPQTIENRESVGIDISPVQDVGVCQSSQPGHAVDFEALTPDDDAAFRDIDRQIGDLVLDDYRHSRLDRELCQLLGTHRQLSKRVRETQRGRGAQPNQSRLGPQTKSG